LRDDFRCFRSKMCYRTKLSTVPLNSPITASHWTLWSIENNEMMHVVVFKPMSSCIAWRIKPASDCNFILTLAWKDISLTFVLVWRSKTKYQIEEHQTHISLRLGANVLLIFIHRAKINERNKIIIRVVRSDHSSSTQSSSFTDQENMCFFSFLFDLFLFFQECYSTQFKDLISSTKTRVPLFQQQSVSLYLMNSQKTLQTSSEWAKLTISTELN